MDMGTLKGMAKLISEGKLSLSEPEMATIMQKVVVFQNRFYWDDRIFTVCGIRFIGISNLNTSF